jgi:hypothetical protein
MEVSGALKPEKARLLAVGKISRASVVEVLPET